ncbi:MAG TPA: AAA family ATPase [Gammaproteobacteria bacterium]|nr:AAA family ATPase [Gammaproteobacteria bacterium]
MRNIKPNSQHSWSEIISMLESIPDPAVLIGLDYKILAVNHAYEQNYETTSRRAQQKFCYEISHRYTRPCDEAGETCPLKHSLSSGQPHRVLHLHYTPRGDEHVDVEMHPILDKDRKPCYFLETMRTSKVASSRADGDGLIGRSPPFNHMLELIERAAPTEVNILLLGESGTGKELVSQAIHKVSKHASGPFVALECSGLTESLFESELFGHEKGAFTGAVNRKIGLVEVARGGTLFLDEIGDIPYAMQVKLLRLIESQTYRRVGSTESQKADFRLICATHHNLQAQVAEGKFRQDLFYRISAFPIELPSLRDRLGDIPLLINYLLKKNSPKASLKLDEAAHLLNLGAVAL